MGEVLVVQSKVKALGKKLKLRVSGDVIPELSKQIEHIIARAGTRAKANRRSTIKASDV